MFIQAKPIKGNVYFYLVHSKKIDGDSGKEFQIYLGNHEKVDALFQHYSELKKSWIQ